MPTSSALASPRGASPIHTDPTALAAQSIDELDAAICRLARHLNSESYRLLVLVRALDERMGWAKWSFPNCAEWLAWRCGLSLSAAREKVRTAHALRDLPQISAAFRDGRLSYSKVRALTRAASAQDEDLLLAYALEATAAQVEERCRQIRNIAPESVDVARRAWERRSLSVWRNPASGTLRVTVEVPVEDGELIVRALDRAVEDGEVASGPEFGGAGWHAQQADALVAVARAYLEPHVTDAVGVTESRDQTPEQTNPGESVRQRTSIGDHYQVVVHVDETALRGGPGRSDLPLETIKRLTCSGSMIAVVDDERGSPLAVSRRRRTVSTTLMRALWSRDRGCSFPGCERSHYVDAHHIHHWANGGATSLENLTLLCSYHHRLLHEGCFRIGHDTDGSLSFRRPDGRAIPRFGYRAADWLDDGVDDCVDDDGANGDHAGRDIDGHPSAEAFASAHRDAEQPSAEVRESRATYLARDHSATMHETKCAPPISLSAGCSSVSQRGTATGQRDRNLQWRPGLATSRGRDKISGSGAALTEVAASAAGTAAMSAFVYGCLGPCNTASVPPSSTTLPRYITATRSHT